MKGKHGIGRSVLDIGNKIMGIDDIVLLEEEIESETNYKPIIITNFQYLPSVEDFTGFTHIPAKKLPDR